MAVLQIGAGEFLVIALLALIVLGPERLPHAARFVGQLFGSVRSMATSFQTEMERASDGFIEDAAREKGRLQIEEERAKRRSSPSDTPKPKDPANPQDGSKPKNPADPDDLRGPQGNADTQDTTAEGTQTSTAEGTQTSTAEGTQTSTAEGTQTSTAEGTQTSTAENGLRDTPAVVPKEPDRSEKPHSAPMYPVEQSSATPVGQLQADAAHLTSSQPRRLAESSPTANSSVSSPEASGSRESSVSSDSDSAPSQKEPSKTHTADDERTSADPTANNATVDPTAKNATVDPTALGIDD